MQTNLIKQFLSKSKGCKEKKLQCISKELIKWADSLSHDIQIESRSFNYQAEFSLSKSEGSCEFAQLEGYKKLHETCAQSEVNARIFLEEYVAYGGGSRYVLTVSPSIPYNQSPDAGIHTTHVQKAKVLVHNPYLPP